MYRKTKNESVTLNSGIATRCYSRWYINTSGFYGLKKFILKKKKVCHLHEKTSFYIYNLAVFFITNTATTNSLRNCCAWLKDYSVFSLYCLLFIALRFVAFPGCFICIYLNVRQVLSVFCFWILMARNAMSLLTLKMREKCLWSVLLPVVIMKA